MSASEAGRSRVVIDTDPGIDDGVAILFALASGAFEVLGLTTVAGNIGIAATTRNAGRLLAALGAEVPVISGAAAPLARVGIEESAIHGQDGLGGVAFPAPATAPAEGAVAWLADLLMREPEGSIDLLALGPLTNLALLLREAPAAAARLGRVIAMGGAVQEPGNVGPRAEFNLAVDPEAAAEVMAAELDLTLVPLDVTRRVRATLEDCAQLRASGQPAAEGAAGLIEAYFQTTATESKVAESRPLHDPCVMLLALRPDLFRCEELTLAVDCRLEPGALEPAPEAPPVRVALGVDAPAALALLIRGLTGAPLPPGGEEA